MAWAALATAVLQVAASASAGGEAGAQLRPADPLIGPLSRRHKCALTRFEGPPTALYSDRPYHTDVAVPELSGRAFCRGKRHGQEVWILDVTRATTFYALASASQGLEAGGWRALETPVRVDAAGLALDRLYARRVEPGRYAIHHGHATTASPVFFDPADARVVPIPAPDHD